jgi:hypothetical protein
MNIHSRLLLVSRSGTNPNDLPAPIKAALTAQGLIGLTPGGY